MLFIYTTIILPLTYQVAKPALLFVFKMCIVSNTHSFKTLAQKDFRAPFSLKYRPPKKTLFPGKLPLRGIIKIVILDSFRVYIYTTVNLPGRQTGVTFFSKCALSVTHIRLRHLPQKLSEPCFLSNTGHPKKTLLPGKLPLRGIMKIVV